MKSILSIGLSLLILLGGLQIHLATHYCSGRFVSAKISLTGKKAGCGMEAYTTGQNPAGESVHSDCCRNYVSVFSLNDYIPDSYNDVWVPEKKITQVREPHFLTSYLSSGYFQFTHTVTKPPGIFLSEFTASEFLCVFRI
jgi:hypothetical protein